jgi:hypothetical protein
MLNVHSKGPRENKQIQKTQNNPEAMYMEDYNSGTSSD